MPRIIYIRAAKEKNLLLLGIAEEGESARYTVSERIYSEIGYPQKGAELDEQSFETVLYEDELYRARKKALSLLSLADNNEKSLARKLSIHGIRREIAEEVTHEMVSLGYINEERQLERLILNEANFKLSGPMKLIPRLCAKGYSSNDVKSVLHRLCDAGEIDFTENARRLCEKKLSDPSDREEKNKLLYKYGYKKC